MATKAKTPAAKKAIAKKPEEPLSPIHVARVALSASCNAVAVIEEYGKPFGEQNIQDLVNELSDSIKAVQGGDMKRCEAMLMGQAHALQSIFMNFSRRALKQEYQKNLESYFRMAMKAQNQCRMTLETLATIKNPPIVYAKQANIAHGPQQVNNGTPAPAHTEKILNQSNELLEHQHGNTLDTGTAGETAGHDPAMATLGTINGAEVARG